MLIHRKRRHSYDYIPFDPKPTLTVYPAEEEESALVVSPEDGRILWTVSWTALGSGLIAAANGKYDLAATSWLGCGTSLLYWNNPTYSWRRNLDILTMQFCLGMHMWRAAEAQYGPYYYGITGLGILLFACGWLAAARGLKRAGTWLHVGVHACANTANIALYLS